MNRAKPWAHKRNAILVAVHYDLKELKQDLLNIEGEHLPEQLKELIDWAVKKLV
jgi:hypothetical protein